MCLCVPCGSSTSPGYKRRRRRTILYSRVAWVHHRFFLFHTKRRRARRVNNNKHTKDFRSHGSEGIFSFAYRIANTIIYYKQILNLCVLTCCQNWARRSGPCDLVVNQSKDSISLQQTSQHDRRLQIHFWTFDQFFFILDCLFLFSLMIYAQTQQNSFSCWNLRRRWWTLCVREKALPL